MAAQLRERKTRLAAEIAALPGGDNDPIRDVEAQLAQENADLAEKQASIDALQAAVAAAQARVSEAGESWQRESRSLADLEARAQALAALQAKVGHGEDRDDWLSRVGLGRATHLYTTLDVDAGWNDALEAVLRERLEAIELPTLDRALEFEAPDAAPPARLALYAPAPARHGPAASGDALIAKVRIKRADVSRLVADALDGVRCRPSLAQALADRDALAVGESFVTPAGHLVTAQTVTLFRPDGNMRPLEEIEADVIRLAIGHYRGRMTEVARRLGIGRSTLYRKLGELGIDNAA